MHIITTKYYGPSSVRGSRIKATAGGRSVTIPYPYEKNTEQAHIAAAKALVEKLGWSGEWYGGPDDTNGYVFVSLDKTLRFKR